MKQGGFAALLVLLIVVLVGGAGVGWYLSQKGIVPKFSGPVTTEQPPAPPPVPGEDASPAPTGAGETENWKTHTFDSIKLTFKAPPDLFVTGQEQKNSDTGVSYSFTLYVQNYDDTHPLPSGKKFYQLYGVFQWSSAITDAEFQAHKEDFIASSIKEVTVGGYPGIRGQYKGERNRYVTMFIKNGGLFTLSTSYPLPENEILSNQILSTFKFLP